MDINHRKTVLDDDATLYNRKHDTVTKEDLKNLPFKQKLHYFKDYYAKIVIATVVVLIGVIMILNETIFNRHTCVMAVATLSLSSKIKNRFIILYPSENKALQSR